MNKSIRAVCLFVALSAAGTLVSSFQRPVPPPPYRFPYRQAGLSEREAAAHLISRFTFGATPGQIDAVVKMGLEDWFAAQLESNLPDEALDARLANYESLRLSNSEMISRFPRDGQVLKWAIQDGRVHKDSVAKGRKAYKDDIAQYMQEIGVKPQSELFRQLVTQKILRAAYSNNQLREVLVDFWFNHFNVAYSKSGIQPFVTSYERDAIRPHVLGAFETLLLATAKSPAMLIYLDNNKSSVSNAAPAPVGMMAEGQPEGTTQPAAPNAKKGKRQGLNENYAREIMELHTLGVDGGYTQTDVTEAARVLTGWRINPQLEYGQKSKNIADEERAKKLGFVYDDNFFFAPQKHDRSAKTVLGKKFPAGGGYEEGVALIHLLATHPATATFISRKLAVRFVSDAPPQTLVDKMAQTFSQSGGDIKQVLIAMASAPAFWSKAALREKTKSPFELAIGAVRSTGTQIVGAYALYQWIAKMGQKLYHYQPPTGFPDRGPYWINTGALLNRMNFGLALAAGRIKGTTIDLLALNNHHEPESAQSALLAYSRLLLPERNTAETVKRLTPMLAEPALAKKVAAAAGETATANAAADEGEEDAETGKAGGASKESPKTATVEAPPTINNSYMLAQVVGIIIGSPEFQRR